MRKKLVVWGKGRIREKRLYQLVEYNDCNWELRVTIQVKPRPGIPLSRENRFSRGTNTQPST